MKEVLTFLGVSLVIYAVGKAECWVLKMVFYRVKDHFRDRHTPYLDL